MGSLNSFVLWKGPSAIDGEPIVLIATGVLGKRGGLSTANRKTGAMTQLWIMPDGVRPWDAVRQGHDHSVCGSCPLRPLAAKAAGKKIEGNNREVCYLYPQIRAFRGPGAVARTYMKGRYPQAQEADMARVKANPNGVRWGAWGDPLAIPMDVLRSDPMVSALTTVKHTGYTHRWRDVQGPDAAWVQTWLMASVGSEEEAKHAWSLGWRTFRNKETDQPKLAGEISCPASKEAGNKTTCAQCNLCRGTQLSPKRRVSVVINNH